MNPRLQRSMDVTVFWNVAAECLEECQRIIRGENAILAEKEQPKL